MVFERDADRNILSSADYVIDPSLYTSFQDDVGQHAKAFVVYSYCRLSRLDRMFKETNNILSSN